MCVVFFQHYPHTFGDQCYNIANVRMTLYYIILAIYNYSSTDSTACLQACTFSMHASCCVCVCVKYL